MDPTFRQVCEYYNHDFYPTFYDTAAVLGGLQHIARIKSPLGQRIPISAPCVLTTAGRWSVALMAATTMYVGVAGATNMMEMPHKRRDSESGRSALEIARERRKMSNVFDAAGMTATLIWSFKRVMAGNVGVGVRMFRVIGAYSIGGAVGTGAYMAWTGLFGKGPGLQGL
ncbi:uncharacterized protein RHO25_005774 [Cercospora beticola]|nr:hypothetical protein RHO25_005774 [Cercospora beticola]